jgi:hypothetical protein
VRFVEPANDSDRIPDSRVPRLPLPGYRQII